VYQSYSLDTKKKKKKKKFRFSKKKAKLDLTGQILLCFEQSRREQSRKLSTDPALLSSKAENKAEKTFLSST
jgi:hypothetical protein